MVSTRGVRYKFSEGERVLCYEPDPTKAKVLYDSKVLEVIENKDKRGRRTVEYLIHFQGWNSSWDRCVSEDFVLKDTVENRHLQRDLADKSQLQLGAYLYRRERKKGGGATPGAGAGKRSRLGFSDDGSSTSTQPDEGEVGETDSSSGASDSRSPPPGAPPGRAQINLPAALRDRLTFDYHLVVKRGLVSRLPATPCAAHILESFVKWFARAGAWRPARGRHDAPQRPDMMDVSCRLNLVREVADGMRVYFDFVLRGHLLYKQEQRQYQEVCGRFREDAEDGTSEPPGAAGYNQSTPDYNATEEDLKSPKMPEYSHLPPDPMDVEKNGDGPALAVIEQSLKSPKIPEFAHLPPDPVEGHNFRVLDTNNHEVTVKVEAKYKPAKYEVALATQWQNQASSAGKTREGRAARRTRNLARRLRSHKPTVSQPENGDPVPSTSTGEPRVLETLSSSVGSSGSSVSDNWLQPPRTAPAAPPATRTPLSLLLDKVSKWQVVPREGTEHLPCRVYGAIHLARLFVKLPDFLNATQMPDFKLKLVLKYIDMFVQYLDEHGEWFGEMYYISDNSSLSH